MTHTPEHITHLEPNQIFVYGANNLSIHGAGAAKQALEFGAKIGHTGLHGKTYGIVTKWHNPKTHSLDTLSLSEIHSQIANFWAIASVHPELEFLVTKIGTGLAGYSIEEIADLFMRFERPDNVILPIAFDKRQTI